MRGLSVPRERKGIAQFMPRTASWHGLADPFDPMESLRHSAAYLRTLELDFSPGFAGRPRSAKLRKSHCLQPTEQLKKLKPRLCWADT